MRCYWAVKRIDKDLTHVRVERANTPLDAMRVAFGVIPYKQREMRVHQEGIWMVKNLGVKYLSDNNQLAIIENPEGWVDPFKSLLK